MHRAIRTAKSWRSYGSGSWSRRLFATLKESTQTEEKVRKSPHEHFVFEFDEYGGFTPQAVSRRDLLKHIPGLQTRDLRTETTISSSVIQNCRLNYSVEPSPHRIASILVRDGVILMKMDYFKAIIRPKSVLLFDAELPVVQRFADSLQSYLRTRMRAEPYEFRAMEAILGRISEDYEHRFAIMAPVIHKVLTSIGEQTDIDDALMRLVPIKRALINFEFRVKEFRSAVEDVLKSDEDLCGMYLTYKAVTKSPRPIEQHVEAEMLLENYAKKGEEIQNQIAQLRENIKATELAIELSLDSTRNHLMRLTLNISMTGLMFSCGSLLAGVYGMNLINGLEHHPTAFTTVVTAIGISSAALYMLFYALYASRTRHVRSISKQIGYNSFFDSLNSPDYVHRIWNQLDRKDFKFFLQNALGKDIPMEEVLEIFDSFDKNDDGLLDREELAKAFEENVRQQRQAIPMSDGSKKDPVRERKGAAQ